MPLGGRSKNAKRSILRADEKAKALDMKRAGLTLRQIAKALNCSLTKAYELVDEGRREIPEQAREAYVNEIHERQLAIVAAHWKNRHLPEHAKVIQASDQFLARLLGLEAPKQQHIEVATTGVNTLNPNDPAAVSQRLREVFREQTTTTTTTHVASSDSPSADGAGEVPERAPSE